MKNNYPLPIFLAFLFLASLPLNANSTFSPYRTIFLSSGDLLFPIDSLAPQSPVAGGPTAMHNSSTASTQTEAASACGATVTVGDDQYFCNTVPAVTQIVGFVSGNVLSYYWSPVQGLATPTGLNSQVTVYQPITYTLTARSLDPDINLIVNGDFEQGNRFFKSGYTHSLGDLVPIGVYDVLTNPQKANPNFPACGDHTTGLGNMLATSPLKEEELLWEQTVPVTPLTDYNLSGWALRLNSVKPALRIYINHMPPASIAYPGLNCTWWKFSRFINSGNNTQITISIYKGETVLPSAVAIDDLYLSPICEVKDSMSIYFESVDAMTAPKTYLLPPCGNQEITIHGSGSSSGLPIIYNWTTADGHIVSGENTPDPVVDAPGTYTLTVGTSDTRFPNCTSTATVEVIENQYFITSWIVPAQALNCVIKQTTLTAATNQNSNPSYQWTASDGGNIVSGANSKVAMINAPGTYTVIVTDNATGCTSESEIVIPNNTTPPTVAANTNPLTCKFQQAVLSGAGSSTGPDFIYSWSTPDGKILSGKDSLYALTDTVGTYILKVTNISNLCTATDTVLVSQNTASPIPVVLPAETLSCLQSNVTLSVDSIAYTGPQLVYAWSHSPGGNIVSGADSLAPVVNAPAWYTLVVTDTLSGCTGRDSILVTADTLAIIAVANAPQPLTCTATQVQLDAIGSTNDPAMTYQWTTANGNILSGADTPTPTVDAPGTYQLLLVNTDNGCSATDLAVVIQNITPPPVSIQAAAPLTCLLPQQTLQGQNANPSGNFNYQWSASNGGNIVSGETSLTPLVNAAGTYTLLTTNQSSGCTSENTVQLTSDTAPPNAALSVSGNLNCNVTEVNLNNNSSTDPSLLNHVWTNPDGTTGNSGADPNWKATQAGAYLLLLTNTQNGCTSTATATVIQNEAVTAEMAAQTNVSCFGGSDGALSVNAGGGNGTYTYEWNTGENSPAIQNLAAGSYTVVVTDGENCSTTLSLLISQPDELLANALATGLTSPGGDDGTATAAPIGGTAPYSYAWSNGQTDQTINNLPAGFYTVTVTDAKGCTSEQTVEVWDGNCALTASTSGADPSCHGLANGLATVLPSNGAAPLSYAWSSGATTQTAENLAAGVYEVVVTDANDCAFTSTITLNDPPLLTLEPVEVLNTSCPNSAEGSATVQAAGGTGTLSIEWSNGQQGEQATGLIAGTYTATATDANGCTASQQVTILANDTEPPVIQANPVTLPVGPAGSVTLTPQNLGLVVTDNCAVKEVKFVPESFNCLQLGVQQVAATAVDASGNSSFLSFAVSVVDIEAPVVVCPANIRRCSEDAIVEYTAPVATDNCLMLGGHFDLIEGLPSGEHFPEGTTTTTYTYTDFSGNVGSCSFEVTILTPLEIATDAIIHDVGGQHTGGVQVTVSGSVPGYTYAWQQNGQTIATTEDLTGVGAGIYTLLVTDARGCTRVAGPYEVSDLVNTGDADWSRLIAVYPNPTSGTVFVVLPDALTGAEIHFSVFDARGRKVQGQNSSGQKQLVLDWTAFADGLYTVLIRAEQGQAVYRVVLDR